MSKALSQVASLALILVLALAGCAGQNPPSGEPAGVTVEEFHKMNEWDKFILMGCQINKQKEQIGTQETGEWLREGEREAMKQDTEDIRPVQIDYIKEEGIILMRAEMREWEKTS